MTHVSNTHPYSVNDMVSNVRLNAEIKMKLVGGLTSICSTLHVSLVLCEVMRLVHISSNVMVMLSYCNNN